MKADVSVCDAIGLALERPVNSLTPERPESFCPVREFGRSSGVVGDGEFDGVQRGRVAVVDVVPSAESFGGLLETDFVVVGGLADR